MIGKNRCIRACQCLLLLGAIAPIWTNDAAYAEGVLTEAARGSIAVEPYGFALYPIPSRGLELAANIQENSSIAVNYSRGEQHHLLMHYQADLLLIRYRHYFDEWIRAQLGVGVSQIRQFYETHLADASPVTVSANRQMLVGETSLGHELHFGPILLACDWFGLVIPMSKIAQKQSASEGVDLDDKKENEDAFDRISFVPALQILRFSIGVLL